MEKHFELTNNTKVINNVKLHQIRATRDSFYSKKGELGGYVEKLENLSGKAWIERNAVVMDNASVMSYARIMDDAIISGNARITGGTIVAGYTKISKNAIIKSNNDFCTFTGFGSENITITAFKSKIGIEICCGCFSGTLKKFEDEVKKINNNNKLKAQYFAMIKMIKLKLK